MCLSQSHIQKIKEEKNVIKAVKKEKTGLENNWIKERNDINALRESPCFGWWTIYSSNQHLLITCYLPDTLLFTVIKREIVCHEVGKIVVTIFIIAHCSTSLSLNTSV